MINSIKKAVYLAIFLFVLLITSCAAVQKTSKTSNNWELIKINSEDNWKMYRKIVPNSNSYQFKITSQINSPLRNAQIAVKKMVVDPKYYQSKKGKPYGSFKILEQDSTSFILYSYMIGPFFIKDRDVVVKYELYKNHLGTEMGMKWHHTDFDGYEPKEKVIRMPIDIGDWNFKYISENSCEVSHVLQFHPGGKMSKWIINMMVKSRLPEELENLKHEAKLLSKE